MAYLINDNLIWVCTTKCASFSIENALLNSNLKLEKYKELFTKGRHIHPPLVECLNYFGHKESVCITRDWFERWLSAFNYIWDIIELYTTYTPIYKLEDIDNDIIYNIFNDDFVNKLYTGKNEDLLECFLKLIKDDTDVPMVIYSSLPTILPERFWKSNEKCTYEFNIKELDKFVDFIEDRFGEKLQLDTLNASPKRPNKIIVNDKLKSFVWEKFEKRFEKRNQLI